MVRAHLLQLTEHTAVERFQEERNRWWRWLVSVTETTTRQRRTFEFVCF